VSETEHPPAKEQVIPESIEVTTAALVKVTVEGVSAHYCSGEMLFWK